MHNRNPKVPAIKIGRRPDEMRQENTPPAKRDKSKVPRRQWTQEERAEEKQEYDEAKRQQQEQAMDPSIYPVSPDFRAAFKAESGTAADVLNYVGHQVSKDMAQDAILALLVPNTSKELWQKFTVTPVGVAAGTVAEPLVVLSPTQEQTAPEALPVSELFQNAEQGQKLREEDAQTANPNIRPIEEREEDLGQWRDEELEEWAEQQANAPRRVFGDQDSDYYIRPVDAARGDAASRLQPDEMKQADPAPTEPSIRPDYGKLDADQWTKEERRDFARKCREEMEQPVRKLGDRDEDYYITPVLDAARGDTASRLQPANIRGVAGYRWYMICPTTDRRATVLYLRTGTGVFAHRLVFQTRMHNRNPKVPVIKLGRRPDEMRQENTPPAKRDKSKVPRRQWTQEERAEEKQEYDEAKRQQQEQAMDPSIYPVSPDFRAAFKAESGTAADVLNYVGHQVSKDMAQDAILALLVPNTSKELWQKFTVTPVGVAAGTVAEPLVVLSPTQEQTAPEALPVSELFQNAEQGQKLREEDAQTANPNIRPLEERGDDISKWTKEEKAERARQQKERRQQPAKKLGDDESDYYIRPLDAARGDAASRLQPANIRGVAGHR